MAVISKKKLSRASALALVAASLALPGLAQARPDGDAPFGMGNRGGGGERVETDSRPNGGGNQNAGSNGGGQQGWGGRGGNGGGWSAPQAPAPVISQPAPTPRWGGNAPDAGNAGRWGGGNWQQRDGNRDSNRDGNRSGGGNWNGGRQGGNWGGNPVPTPPPVVNTPAPANPQGWNGGSWQQRDGNRDRWRDGNNNWQNRDGNRDRDRDRDGDRWRNNNANNGTFGWRGQTQNDNRWRDRDRDRDRDHDRWRGNNGWNNGWNNHRGYGQDYRRWDNRWRSNHRYDWHSYRRYNPSIFQMGIYYAPYRNYSYRRIGIGFFLDNLFFGSRYWINNPWDYRLPEAYGPYRWVRYYDDALLVNTYSGEVVDVIYDFFW